jgi:hypothetical protein
MHIDWRDAMRGEHLRGDGVADGRGLSATAAELLA